MRWRKSILFVNLLVLVLLVSTLAGIRVVKANTDVWEIATSPNEGSGSNWLWGVNAFQSDTAVAVGSRYDTGTSSYNATIQNWDGSAWSVVTSPSVTANAELFGVTSVPDDTINAVGEFWAVGYKIGSSRTLDDSGLWYNISGSQTLIEHSTNGGASWSAITSSPNPSSTNVLRGVSARTGSDIWAVGYSKDSGNEKTLILHYNGSSWSQIPSPNVSNVQNYLYGVSALASDDVWAVGFTRYLGAYNTLTMHYNGSTWSTVSSPNPGPGVNYLFGVAMLGSDNVYAVGSYFPTGDPTKKTLMERYHNSSWSQVTSEDVGTAENYLWGISPVSSSSTWDVGAHADGHYRTLVELDGSAVSSPNQGSDVNELRGVSATPDSVFCIGGDSWAVGWYYDTNASLTKTLIERYTISSCSRP